MRQSFDTDARLSSKMMLSSLSLSPERLRTLWLQFARRSATAPSLSASSTLSAQRLQGRRTQEFISMSGLRSVWPRQKWVSSSFLLSSYINLRRFLALNSTHQLVHEGLCGTGHGFHDDGVGCRFCRHKLRKLYTLTHRTPDTTHIQQPQNWRGQRHGLPREDGGVSEGAGVHPG